KLVQLADALDRVERRDEDERDQRRADRDLEERRAASAAHMPQHAHASSNVVVPSSTYSSERSTSVRMPSARAAWRRSSRLAPSVTSFFTSSLSSEKTSKTGTRPRKPCEHEEHLAAA